MLSEAQKRDFDRNGFLVVPNVVTKEQIAELRRLTDDVFANEPSYAGDIKSIRFDVFARHPELRWLLSHEPILSALRSLLGDDFVMVPEASMHDAVFAAWHKDTTSQERAGHRFHWDPKFLMVEAGLYLQDNSQFGGGLDVITGSHKKSDIYPAAGKIGLLTRVRNKIRKTWRDNRFTRHTIPSKAGDLVIFDFRVDHAATLPQTSEAPPADQRKRAIFWACGRNNALTGQYMDFIRSRPDYVYLRDHAYPPEVVDIAREHGLNMPDGRAKIGEGAVS